MSIGFRFAATWPTFPTFNGSRLKCPCKKDQSSPGEFTGVPALATRRRYSVCSGEREGFLAGTTEIGGGEQPDASQRHAWLRCQSLNNIP